MLMIVIFPILATFFWQLFFLNILKYFKVESREEKERGSAICTDREKVNKMLVNFLKSKMQSNRQECCIFVKEPKD